MIISSVSFVVLSNIDQDRCSEVISDARSRKLVVFHDTISQLENYPVHCVSVVIVGDLVFYFSVVNYISAPNICLWLLPAHLNKLDCLV